jgi:protein-S-isoprenylcysteine O-methyltransferase Ste14
MKTWIRMTLSSVIGLAIFGLILFLPAGTLNYWQAWVFIATFSTSTTLPSIYLARTHPATLQRRMQAGPWAESRTIQKFVITAAFGTSFAMLLFSAFDHRMRWSAVPAWLCLLGDVLVAAGLAIAMLVTVQNAYAAANVTVETGQTLVSGGVYKFVRHPMYVGTLIVMFGIPLALGSYCGLLFIVPGMLVLVLRIRDEEKVLAQELSGYREYMRRVRYRLVPYIW